jgi:hypothetical protein
MLTKFQEIAPGQEPTEEGTENANGGGGIDREKMNGH